MARKFKYNGNIYSSMMGIAKELGISRLYPRDFAKYGVEEVTGENNVQTGDVCDLPRTTTCSDGTAQFYDPTTRKELETLYGEKPFNKKAFVTHIQKPDGYIKYLVSYGGVVAKIENDKAEVYGTYSSETLTHIREFLQQNGFKAETCVQIREDYMK